MASQPAELDAPVRVGEVLAGKYRVERVLGVGGMGVVVQATHLDLDQRVAIKWMLSDFADKAEAFPRFLREAKAAARLSSEHVARVMDVGRLEGDQPYMVMEYLSGRDLADVLRTEGPLPVDTAVNYLLQAAEAHSHGIVHRDLKPSNLFLTSRIDGTPLVKVLDFGISKLSTRFGDGGPPSDLTSATAMLGTPAYMSPEQMRSAKRVDARSDVWALGLILYELLAGVLAFEADCLQGLIAAVSLDPATPIRTHRPDLPPELEAIVMRCLEKRPEDRYQDVGELAVALEPFGPPGASVLAWRAVHVLRGAGMTQPSAHGPSPKTAEATVASDAREQTVGTFGVTAAGPPKGRTAVLVVASVGALVMVSAASGWVYQRAGVGNATPADLLSSAALVNSRPVVGAEAGPDSTEAIDAVETQRNAEDAGAHDAGVDASTVPAKAVPRRRTPERVTKTTRDAAGVRHDKTPDAAVKSDDQPDKEKEERVDLSERK